MSSTTPGESAVTAEAAVELIVNSIQPITRRSHLDLRHAAGRIAASQHVAAIEVPPFRNSAMDGYALRYDDRQAAKYASNNSNPVELREAGVALAGHPFNGTLGAGECVRITTGAMLPEQTDCIVIKEDTQTLRKGSDTLIRVNAYPDRGEHVRAVGSNIAAGQTLCQQGEAIRPALYGLMASAGLQTMDAIAPLKVALFSSGDELRDPGDSLGAGQIHDANRYFLRALLDSPNIETVDLGIAEDTLDAHTALLEQAKGADVLLSSGGVSVGEADVVKQALSAKGELHMWKVLMKPGKPLTYGELSNGAKFFGLPGNPVSAFVTFSIFVIPALRKMLGMKQQPVKVVRAQCMDELVKLPGRMELQRGILESRPNGSVEVRTTGLQDSHVLASIASANCFIRLAIESSGVTAGSQVEVLPFENFSL